MFRWVLTIILLALAGCDLFSPNYPAYEAAKRLPLDVCEIEGIREPLLCGTFSVFENRKAGEGRTIPVKVVVIPAQEERTTQTAWIEHHGGPRYSMVGAAPAYAKGGWLEWFRRNRDVVLIDPRGLHESGALFCKALEFPRVLEHYYPSDRVRACREELEKKADLSQYSTLNAIDDFEDIRKWLGYAQWDVGGWSFGSRYMLTYMHRYPDAIRTISLFIPSILNFDRPLDYARFGQQAMDRLIASCQADAACNKKFPDIAGDLDSTLARLAAKPQKIEFIDPYTNQPVTKHLTRGVFAEELWAALLSNYAARELPFILLSSAEGNFQPFLDAYLAGEPEPSEPEGHYFSVVCPEETGYLDRDVARAASEGTFVGSYTADMYIDACEAWGLALHPEHPMTPEKFDIPVLIVTGDHDPVTPPQYGEQISKHFRDPVHINVPEMAHGTSGMKNADCLDGILDEFVNSGTMERIDISCVDTIEPPPFRLK